MNHGMTAGPNKVVTVSDAIEQGITLFDVVHKSLHVFAFVAGVLSTAMAIYLIGWKTHNSFKAFSRVLMLCACSDMLYLLCVLYCQERRWISNVLHVSEKLDPAKYLSHYGQCVVFTARTSIMLLAYVILPIQFHYRYWLLKHNFYSSFPKLIPIYIIFAVFFGLLSAYISFQAYCTIDNIDKVDYSTFWCVEIPMPQFGEAAPNQVSVLVQRAFFCILLAVSYACVLLFAYLTYRELKQKAERLTAATMKLQQQFSRALLMQSVVPLVIVVVPILITTLEGITPLRIGHSGDIADLSVTFFPLLNSLSTLIFISHYRRECIRILFPCFRKSLVGPYTTSLPEDTSMMQYTN